jgi:integrase
MATITYTRRLPQPYQVAVGGGKIGWRAQKILTIAEHDGSKRRHIVNTTRKTPDEAVFALLERLAKISSEAEQIPQPRHRNVDAEVIDDLLNNHLADLATGEGAISEATADTYRHLSKAILNPKLGLTGTPLSELTHEKIGQWRELLDITPTARTGKPYGPTRKNKITIFFNDAMRAAVATGKIPTNPLEAAKTPVERRRAKLSAKQEAHAKFERNEQEQIAERLTWFPQLLLQKLRSDFERSGSDWAHTRLTYVALSFLGIRPAEIRGLTISKIRLTKGKETLTISQTMIRSKIVNATKTRGGTRVLPLVEPWLSIILEQVRRRKIATKNQADAFLLTTESGALWRQQNQSTDYAMLLDQMNLERVRLYANRHITVSALQLLGADMTTISEIVGWEKPTAHTMLEVYGHYRDEAAVRDALVKLGKFFTQEPQQPEA